jgi:hypothetical protein
VGYLITAGHPPVHGESITDGQWLDILKHARDAGFSRPPLTLARGEAKDIPEDEARGLYDHLWVALGTSLKDSPVTEVEGANLDVLDRETVQHVCHVLRYLGYREVRLVRTPPWKSGDEPPDISGERS